MSATASTTIDREAAILTYRDGRARTESLFGIVAPEAYYDRPIALRNPICFYEGHLPAFSVNTLVKRGLGQPGVREDFETLFERGIDPEDASRAGGGQAWPPRREIRAYAAAADERILAALAREDVDRDDSPVLRRGLAVYTVLEHEPMHQETLCYMWHRLPYEKKIRPARAEAPPVGGEPPPRERVSIPSGRATLGADRERALFGWDNEFPEQSVEVPAFEIDRFSVTNRDFLEFVESGAYGRRELWDSDGWEWVHANRIEHPLFWEREIDGAGFVWRGMFERVPLPAAWPVYVSHAEASAYARWRGSRLPTEAEFHRAAYGTPSGAERTFPWGEEEPDATRGNFDFRRFDPVPAGSFPAGGSAWGVHDLVGNGWEWTSTVFAGFPGFEPMPSYPVYSSDFFDGKHYVLKGASPVTSAALLRRSFRNWFRGNYPYMYAKFRTVN